MSVFRRGNRWWYEFRIRGQRVRGSSHARSKRAALRAERERRRQIAEGICNTRAKPTGVLSLHAKEWVQEMRPHWRASTQRVMGSVLRHVERAFGRTLLTEITPSGIRKYQARRHADGLSGSTINMEIGALRAVLRRHRLWANLQPDVRMLPERTDVGRSLTEMECRRLLAACKRSRSRSLWVAVTLSIATGLRHFELRNLRWGAVDWRKKTICVEKSKTAGGEGRVIPLNAGAQAALAAWREQFRDAQPEHFVFPAEKSGWPSKKGCTHHVEPTRPMGSWGSSWRTARKNAGVDCRWHDLRHTFVSRIAENQVSDATILALAGHMSVRMKERYSHTRLAAKRRAVETESAAFGRRA